MRELTESAKEFLKASARRRPIGSLREAWEQKPTRFGDQGTTLPGAGLLANILIGARPTSSLQESIDQDRCNSAQ